METKKWYEKKKYIIPTLILGFIVVIALGTNNQTTTTQVQDTSYNSQIQTYQPQIDQYQQATETQQENDNLSNDNTYTNVNGTTVHSPAYSENGQVPNGATAECRDGTYSFSLNHRGTCSHHGGVSRWL